MISGRPKVLFVANRSFVLAYSRRKIIETFVKNGWEVLAACECDSRSRQLRELGCKTYDTKFPSGRVVFLQELRAFLRLANLIRTERPDLVHLFNVRPIVMGSFLSRFMLGSEPSVICTITGMGYLAGAGVLCRSLLKMIYSVVLAAVDVTVFQNNADRKELIESSCVVEQRTKVIVSSGVDINLFYPRSELTDLTSLRVIFVGRLLWQKGFEEFVEVARAVRAVDDRIWFDVYGELAENHPDGVPGSFVSKCVDAGYLRYHGFNEKSEDIYGTADVLLFLSRYGEGVPRAVIEASASGVVPVVKNGGWVNDVIKADESGFVVDDYQVEGIVSILIELKRNRKKLHSVSQKARIEMVSRFDEDLVVQEYIEVYQQEGFNLHGRSVKCVDEKEQRLR